MTTGTEAGETSVTEDSGPMKAVRDQLKAEQEARAQAEARLAEVEREGLFVRVGIDTSTAKGQFFAKNYDGELTIEAVQARATELEILSPQEPTTPPAEAQALQDAAATPTHQPPAMPGGIDARILAAKDTEELMAILTEAGLDDR